MQLGIVTEEYGTNILHSFARFIILLRQLIFKDNFRSVNASYLYSFLMLYPPCRIGYHFKDKTFIFIKFA